MAMGLKVNRAKQGNLQGGYAAITLTLLVLAVSLSLIGSFSFFALREVSVNRTFTKAVESRYIGEGGIEDTLYRVLTGKQVNSSETLGVGAGTTTVTYSSIGTDRVIKSSGQRGTANQNLETKLFVSTTGVNFFFGVQVDAGGIDMGNGARVNGNVFSNGSIEGGRVTGTATVASSTSGVQNKIEDSTVDVSARAPAFNNVTVGGSSCPNPNCVVANDSPQSLPIADTIIQGWKDDAVAGGNISGNYLMSVSGSLGPTKITGNLEVSGGVTLTITGTIWVTGTFKTKNNSIIQCDPGYGTNSCVVVADGVVTIENNTTMQGSGQTGSYIMVVGAKNAPTEQVMDINNNSTGAIYYANHGRIHFNNNAAAKEVTAYGMDLDNNATVTYESGLQDVHFSSGPSGGYDVKYWKQVQ